MSSLAEQTQTQTQTQTNGGAPGDENSAAIKAQEPRASKGTRKKKKRATVASRLEDLRKEHERLRGKFLESARKNHALESTLNKKTSEIKKLELAVATERQSKDKLADLCRILQKEGEILRKKQSETDATAETKRQEIQQSLSKIQADIDARVAEGAGWYLCALLLLEINPCSTLKKHRPRVCSESPRSPCLA